MGSKQNKGKLGQNLEREKRKTPSQNLREASKDERLAREADTRASEMRWD